MSRFENELFISYKLSSDMMETKFKPNIVMDLIAAKKMLKDRLDFQEGISFRHLIHFDADSVNKEARDFMTKEGQKGIKAGAFIVGNKVTSVIINFYLSVNKPRVPTKFFTDRSKAIEWLDKQ